jgi:amino acid transporter
MSESSPPKLVRAVGLFSLTALALNGIIGSGIFLLPATVANLLGPASPVAYLISAVAVVLIVLCFAEVGSMFERAGGPYVYARAAFGSFLGFEVGWMFLWARLTAAAAISNALTAYLGYFWPALAVGGGRVATITITILVLAWVNLVGVRYGAWVVNLLTVGKLIPLLLLAGAGLHYVDVSRFASLTLPAIGTLKQASLVLIFAFGGFEFASVPSEEVINPRRNLPIALVTAISLVTVIYILIHMVALGTLPGLATAGAPLASAGQVVFGPAGAVMVTIGAVLSTTGTNSATLLVGPRMLYALARGGHLPGALARVHARYRTPYLSVILFAFFAWAVALYSNFAQLAAVSAIARLLYYITTCLAVPVLRRKMPHTPRRFVVPGGIIIPGLAVAMSAWLLTGSSRTQAIVGGGALLLGAVVYFLSRSAGQGASRSTTTF